MSSACRVYAIAGRGTRLSAANVDGCLVRLSVVPWRELVAVTERIGENDTRLTINAVLRHEAVVEAVRRAGPALPVRFGTVFRDAAAVASALAERYEPLMADLARLGDKVELSVTALWVTSPFRHESTNARGADETAAAKGAGGRYLHARAAELQREDSLKDKAQTLSHELDRVLGKLSLESRASLAPRPRVAMRTAYLVDSGGVREFKAAFESIRGRRNDLRVLLTGPWPPYSFVARKDAKNGAASEGLLAALAQRLTDGLEGRPG